MNLGYRWLLEKEWVQSFYLNLWDSELISNSKVVEGCELEIKNVSVYSSNNSNYYKLKKIAGLSQFNPL